MPLGLLVTSIAGVALAGCSSFSANPVEWWHGLEGGPLARTRPPPPNADAPYPSIGSVPAKPAPPDLATRGRISGGLVADRANAQYTAGLSPLRATPPHAIAPPSKLPQNAAGDDQASNATLQAANAPPPRIASLGPPQPPLPDVVPNPPRPAPVGRVVAAPLPPLEPPGPSPAAPPTAGAADASAGSPPAATPASSAPSAPAPASALPPPLGAAPASAASTAAPDAASSLLPGMPEKPPPMVQLSGVALPKAVAPTPAPSAPVPPPAPTPAPQPGQPVTIAFPPGSAALPPAAVTPLKQLAQRHGGAAIAVTGYGEADSAEPSAQSAALPLALARARSIAAELFADGVPPGAVRLGAQAQGAGGAAQILSN